MGGIIRKKQGSFDIPDHTVYVTTISQNCEQQNASIQWSLGWRHYIAFLCFISGMMVNSQRLAVSVAVVDISSFTSASTLQSNATQLSCPVIFNITQDASEPKKRGDFDWDSKTQGLILGAGYLGYALTQVIGGKLAEAYGVKRVVLWGNVVAALAMLVSPAASWWHSYCMITTQLIRGVAQGFILPATFLTLANWTSRKERGFISSFLFTGFYTGSVVGGLLAGWLCDIPSFGWPSVFYFFGTVGMLFSILFALTYYETPRDHPRISEKEIKYITEDEQDKKMERPPTPWLRMFTSIPTYAVMYALIGQYWGILYFLTVHPMFMSTILHYSILQNGIVSSLPFIVKIAGALIVSSTSDWLYRRKYVGVDKLRKGCNFIGCFVFTLSMLGVYLAKCNHQLNIIFFTIALFSFGVATPGSLITPVDMTPNFAASLMGVLGTISSLSGFILPPVVGILTKNQTLEEWHTVFIINITIIMSSGVIFCIFGSAEVQPWNSADLKTKTNANEAPSSEEIMKEIKNSTEVKIEKF